MGVNDHSGVERGSAKPAPLDLGKGGHSAFIFTNDLVVPDLTYCGAVNNPVKPWASSWGHEPVGVIEELGARRYRL